MAGRARIKGAKSVRRLMKAIPDTMRAELTHDLQDAGPKIARAMQAQAPVRTGALRAGISHKVFPKTLKLQVGLLGTKRGRAKLFYGYILNYGRKAQNKQVQRRTPSGAVSSYLMRIKAFPAQHFVTGGHRALRQQLQQRLKSTWDRVLRKAAGGAGDE